MKGLGSRGMVLLGTSDSKLECRASSVIRVTLLWVTQQHASFLMGIEQCHMERNPYTATCSTVLRVYV